MSKVIRIGTRESQLAVWQANRVKDELMNNGAQAELVYIKSEGDIDTKTPLYEMGQYEFLLIYVLPREELEHVFDYDAIPGILQVDR